MRDDHYEFAGQRLWEKLAYHQNDLDLMCVNFDGKDFVYDQFAKANPIIDTLVTEVEAEMGDNYKMSGAQGSWAVMALHFYDMKEFNQKFNKNLQPRA